MERGAGGPEVAGPPAVVVDASVAVKWFNPEDFHEEALALRDDHVAHRIVLAAPSLLVWEVGNALRYSQELGAGDVKEAMHDLIDLQVVLYEPEPGWLEEAVDEAFQGGLTLYDAGYVALARHLRARLYTADDRMVDVAGKDVASLISEYRQGRRG